MNEKQQKFLDIAINVFGNDLVEKKKDIIVSIINSFLDLDCVEISEEYVKNILNDFIFSDNLFTKYIIPPFSYFDTRSGEWRERRAIIDKYIGSSVVGRKENLTYGKNLRVRENDTGTSQFDSLLTEIIIKWFCPKDGVIYDAFAGGHVRGVMSYLTGHKYIGIDLSKEQVDANIVIGNRLGVKDVFWINDDSINARNYLSENSVDLFFTCPPYGDLEKYTDDPRDLSNMPYDKFLEKYEKIISDGLMFLKDDRFAVIVVGDFRDEKGIYRGFVADTINIFRKNGVGLYNHIILLNNIGTGAMRASLLFRNRKMVKLHQDVLVFYKGSVDNIKNVFGVNIDVSLPVPTGEQIKLF